MLQFKQDLELFPPKFQALNSKQLVVFIDEVLFTKRCLMNKVWAAGGSLMTPREVKTLAFKAVALVAAMDVHGVVQAQPTADDSINTESFIIFLQVLRAAHG